MISCIPVLLLGTPRAFPSVNLSRREEQTRIDRRNYVSMGNVITYISSWWGGQESKPETPEEIHSTEVDLANVPKPDELDESINSVAITSRDSWDDVLDRARDGADDIPVKLTALQLKANIQSFTADTYLCLREGGEVYLDGKKNGTNSVFKVTRVYPPPIEKYQFVCSGGPCTGYVLYPEGNMLKCRPYDREKDNVCKDTADQTLLTIEIQNNDAFQITVESKDGPFTSGGLEPITFIPYEPEQVDKFLDK